MHQHQNGVVALPNSNGVVAAAASNDLELDVGNGSSSVRSSLLSSTGNSNNSGGSNRVSFASVVGRGIRREPVT